MTSEREHTDALFDAISYRRRRHVLSHLQNAGGDAVTLTELVEWMTTQEADGGNGHPEAVATALHHIHLPKLAGVGVLDYDTRSKTVRYRGTELGNGSSAERMVGDLS